MCWMEGRSAAKKHSREFAKRHLNLVLKNPFLTVKKERKIK